MTIPFVDLKAQYKAREAEILSRIGGVLNHGQYIMGPEVSELEQKLCSYTGANNCITVGSGTDALLISLMAIGVKPGDEIITTPFTFIATAEVIVLLGAIPVFVDVELSSLNIDHTRIEEKITDRTKAIMPVSLYGQPSNMPHINEIASKFNLAVIEDAAQSFGAEYGGAKSCNLSTIGCTSFFPSKPLGCYGDGGAIFTSDAEIAQKCKSIRVHGQSKKRYHHDEVGLGARMDTIQCAVVLEKLEIFDEELDSRRRVANEYSKKLSGVVEMVLPAPDVNSAWAQFTILTASRDELRQHLTNKNIPTAIHYPKAVPEQPAYKQFCCLDCIPNTLLAAKQCLSLPFGPYLADDQLEAVVEGLKQFFE